MALPNQSPSTKGSLQSYGSDAEMLVFQFNPTSIRERRGAVYNFSEAQGQVLPQAQYGRIGNTEISFDLFMFNHEGVDLSNLRNLTLPRQLSNFTYYTQAQPNLYELNLHSYGVFIGVVTSVDIKTEQYHRTTLKPVHVQADIKFVQVSLGALYDVQYVLP